MQQTSLFAYRNEIIPVLGFKQKRVYEALKTKENFTNTELAEYLNWKINTITPRIKELRDMEIVEDEGKRECLITGRKVLCWKIKNV